MATVVESNLEILAQYAVWTRDAAWLREWYETIFVPACAETSIAAPLAALDICSAMDRGAPREGKRAARRPGYAGWRQFLEEINDRHQPRLVEQRGGSPIKPTIIARRTLRAFNLSLMSREWNVTQDPWPSIGHGSAAQLLAAEAARLAGTVNDGMLEQVWAVLDADATGQHLHAYLPPATWLNLKNRTAKTSDPFLFPLLELTAEADDLKPPAIWGSNPQAIHSRRRIGATGEFAKRDLGQLPSDLARLAPTELMFFAEAARTSDAKPKSTTPHQRRRSADGKYADELPPISSAALRSLFVMKTSEGRLLQRFSYEADPSTMEPTGMLHVEIADSAEHHILDPKSGAPDITWFRAVAVHLVHQYARFAAKSHWAVASALTYSFSGKRSTGLIPPHYREALAESPNNAFNLLVSANARAFHAGWPGLSEHLPPENSHPPEMDYCLRIVLGTPDSALAPTNGLAVRARQQRGTRIEKAANGRWGLTTTNATAAAQALAVLDLDQTDTDPASVAAIILRAILGTLIQTEGAS